MTMRGSNAARPTNLVSLRAAEVLKKQLNLPTLSATAVLMEWMEQLKIAGVHNGYVYYTSRWHAELNFIIIAGGDVKVETAGANGPVVEMSCLHCRKPTGLYGDTLPVGSEWKLWEPPRLEADVKSLHPLFLLCLDCALMLGKTWSAVVEGAAEGTKEAANGE